MLPNQQQEATLEDWLVTLRKHRNYALRERKDGFETNNQDVHAQVIYAYGSYCDLDSRMEYGSCCPLTCPVLKHGVIPQNLELAFKESKIRELETKKVLSTTMGWDSASGIQMKVTSQLRQSLPRFAAIDSCVLQRNIANLDTAYTNGHIDKSNREGEKFLCVKCKHTEHADTKASRTIAKRVGLVFPKNKKTLPTDCGKVTPRKLSIPECIESRNQAFGNYRHVWETPTVGYLGDTAETPKESPCL